MKSGYSEEESEKEFYKIEFVTRVSNSACGVSLRLTVELETIRCVFASRHNSKLFEHLHPGYEAIISK